MFSNTRRLVLVIAATFVVAFLALPAFANSVSAHSIGPITDIWGNEVGAGLRVVPVDADSSSTARVEPIKDAGSNVSKNIPLIDLPVKLFKTVTSEATNFVSYFITYFGAQSDAGQVAVIRNGMVDTLYRAIVSGFQYMFAHVSTLRIR